MVVAVAVARARWRRVTSPVAVARTVDLEHRDGDAVSREPLAVALLVTHYNYFAGMCFPKLERRWVVVVVVAVVLPSGGARKRAELHT